MSVPTSTTNNKDKAVVGGALIGGLLCFGLLTNTCKNPASSREDSIARQMQVSSRVEKPSQSSQLMEEDIKSLKSEIVELKGQVVALQDNSVDEKIIADLESQVKSQRVLTAEVEKNIANYKTLTLELKSEIQALTKSKEAAEAKAEAKKAEISEADVEKLNTTILELGESLKSEKSKNQKLIYDISAMQSKLNDAEARVNVVVGNQTDSGGSEEARELAKLKQSLKFLNTDNKQLAAELSKTKLELKKLNDTGNKGDAGALSKRVAELAAITTQQQDQLKQKDVQIKEFKAQISKVVPTTAPAQKAVFVESTSDLPTVAQSLFKDLKALEGTSSQELQRSYNEYLEKYGAVAKQRVKFRTGSSQLSVNDKQKIEKLINNAREDAYFFIVGYADKLGSTAGNQKLSSSRAANVARELQAIANGGQSAQAVYLGKTDRFGKSAENRVVEIWEIKTE